jgi:hypothetical protein
MATLGLSVANDIANAVLTFYVRQGALSQTTQDKPLLRTLRAAQETFPGGKDGISTPVQGAYMSDAVTNLQGYSGDESLSFGQAQDIQRSYYPWKEVHSGWNISWTELKQDGITITDNNAMSEHKNANVVRIVDSILKNRIANWMESWARSTNSMFWNNGAQDAKAVPGIMSILTDTPAQGVTGGIDRATYVWWRHRALIGDTKITASGQNQTLTTTLRKELRQLTRYGGKPDVALCGSKFIDALELEVGEKGLYTQQGDWARQKTDIGMDKIQMGTPYGIDRSGNLTFEYDPTLDDLGFSKRCYIIDSSKLKLRPMEGEDNKLLTPERPYNYMVFFKSMTWTGALECIQLNANGVYEVA